MINTDDELLKTTAAQKRSDRRRKLALGRPLIGNPAVSTIIADLGDIFDLAEDATGSMAPDEGQHERDRIARARREVPKMLARLQVLEGALKRAGKNP